MDHKDTAESGLFFDREEMGLIKDPYSSRRQAQSPSTRSISSQCSPVNYSLHQTQMNTLTGNLDYWAYEPMPRLDPSHNVSSSPKNRSVSFSDQATPFFPTALDFQNQHFRSRISSVPTRTVEETDVPLVDDIFNTMTEPDDLAKFSLLSSLPSQHNKESSPRSLPSPGWLEVSINSTLPASPGGSIRRDIFNLSSLQEAIPCKESVHPPAKSPIVLQESSLLKKLLPDPSVLQQNTFSRKVFVGGLPPDIDQEEIRTSFQKYGSVTIDWPHRLHSKSRVPPKGYAFLLFKDETAVRKLLNDCVIEEDKLYIYVKYVTGTAITRKKCQIRPWKISDSFYVMGPLQHVDSRKAVFVGGVPRPLKAVELAEVMSDKFGAITFVSIDTDTELKYPKGAACVVFASHASYIAAVSSRFMQLVFGSLEKKVELKPYILEDQLCDECYGIQSNNQPAPFFCGSVTCLKYYCEHCWATFHSMPGRQNHRPMFKDIFDKDKFNHSIFRMISA